jgi:propionate CoA-transferase
VTKQKSAAEAVALIPDNAVVAVNSSSGPLLPRRGARRLGRGSTATGAPRNLTTIHPIAAGDLFGTKGVDHIAKPGLLAGRRRVLSVRPDERRAAADLADDRRQRDPGLERALGHRLRHAARGARHRPGVLTKVGMDTFVDPERGLRDERPRAAEPIVERREFDGEEWLYFRAIRPDVAIIRATTADQRGNLTFESEGATLGAMEMALAAHNNGGIVIAQVRRVAQNGTLRPHDVRVPGILVDHIVEAPDALQTTPRPTTPRSRAS